MMRGLGVSCFRVAMIYPKPAFGCRTAKTTTQEPSFQAKKPTYGLLRTRAAVSDDRPPAPRIKIPSQSADVYKAKQSLGQNFLVDTNVARKIVASLEDSSEGGKCVIEVGPGKGSLTALLLSQVLQLPRGPRAEIGSGQFGAGRFVPCAAAHAPAAVLARDVSAAAALMRDIMTWRGSSTRG